MVQSKYDIARKRVKKKTDFRAHLASYLVIMGFMLVLNLLTSPGYLWVVWPALGWGIGLAFHAMEAYGLIADKDKEESLIEKEVQRIEREAPGEFLEDHDSLDLREMEKEVRYNEDDLV